MIMVAIDEAVDVVDVDDGVDVVMMVMVSDCHLKRVLVSLNLKHHLQSRYYLMNAFIIDCCLCTTF